MFFTDKDQRRMSWQTKKQTQLHRNLSHLFFPVSLFSSRLELFCRFNGGSLLGWVVGHKSVAYFFFSCHQDVFLISVLQNCSELAFVLGLSVKFVQTCLPLYNFCSHRPLVELLVRRKPTKSPCFLEDIRVPFDYKQEISTKH